MNFASERLRNKALFNTASFESAFKDFPKLHLRPDIRPTIHPFSIPTCTLFVWAFTATSQSSHAHARSARSAPRLNFPFSANFTRIIIGRPKTIKPHERQRERRSTLSDGRRRTTSSLPESSPPTPLVLIISTQNYASISTI